MTRKRKHHLSDQPTTILTSHKRHKSHSVVSPSTQHSVLCQYYPKVQTLRDYLLSELPASSKSRRRRIVSICRSAEAQEAEIESATCQKSQTNIDKDLARLLSSTLVGAGITHAAKQPWTKDFEIFSQQLASTTASIWAEGTTSQTEVSSHRPLATMGAYIPPLNPSAFGPYPLNPSWRIPNLSLGCRLRCLATFL